MNKVKKMFNDDSSSDEDEVKPKVIKSNFSRPIWLPDKSTNSCKIIHCKII
jgi:hypothetical protein